MNVYIGSTGEKLEARFSRLRTEETNLGNFIADVMRTEFQTDFAISHAGALRANCLYDEGPLLLKFVYTVVPYPDKAL